MFLSFFEFSTSKYVGFIDQYVAVQILFKCREQLFFLAFSCFSLVNRKNVFLEFYDFLSAMIKRRLDPTRNNKRPNPRPKKSETIYNR